MVPRRRRYRRARRQGTVLVLFALIVVVVLGTIGLVIELGTVRLDRDRMQSAADSTALEILRERDFDPEGFGASEREARDHGRRERNKQIASWVFDEELLESYPLQEQGAGSYIDLRSEHPQGPSNPMNSQLVVEVDDGQSTPSLRTNYAGTPGSGAALNKRNGDIVSGAFTGHEPGASVGFGGNPIHRENNAYERVDFDVPLPTDAPTSNSVLVRLRRTIPNGMPAPASWNLSLDTETDVSTSGWRRPLVFGLGSSFLGEDPTSTYSIRHHGLSMRATSIAQARPAVRIGAPSSDTTVPEAWRIGAGPIAFRWAEWLSDASFQQQGGTGPYSAVLRLRPPNYEIVSVDHDSFRAGYLYPKTGSQVGDPLDPNALQPDMQGGVDANLHPDYWEVSECYIPLYLLGSLSEGHICGFVRVSIEQIPAPSNCDECKAGDLFMRMTKLENQMSPGEPWLAPRNASATFDGSQPAVVFPTTGRDWDDLIERLHELPPALGSEPYVPESRLYAPAHVR